MTTKVKYIADNVVTVDQIDLSTLSTSNVSEGTNLYYTDARVDSRLSSGSVATISTSGDVTVGGNLTVNGTTTTINSTTLDIDDLNITLASGAANAAAADGAGITVDGASATLTYNSTPDAWSFNKSVGIGITSPSNTFHVYNTTSADVGLIESTQTFSTLAFKSSTNTSTVTVGIDGAGNGAFENKLADGNLTFVTKNSLGTSGEAIRVKGDGKVGVGTTSPSTGLHSALGLRVSGASNQSELNNPTSPSANMGVYESGGTSYGFIDLASDAGSYGGWIDFSKSNGTDYGGRIRYDNSTDELDFYTNGSLTPAIKINSLGQLELNNPNAGQELIISTTSTSAGADPGIQILEPNSATVGAYIFLDTSAGTLLDLESPNGIAFNGSGGAEFARFTSAGNFGIGTSSPSEMLQIDSADSAIRINTTNAANNAELQLLYNNNLAHGMILHYHGNSAVASIDNTYPRSQGTEYGDIRFRQSYAGTMTEHMRLTAYNGYLGIGTSSPYAPLNVKSNTSGTEQFAIRISKNNYADTGGHTTFIGFGAESAPWSKGAIGFQRVASYDVGDFLFCLNSNAGSGTDVSTTDERMRIKYDGRIGIGTSSIDRAKVQINESGITAAAISTGWPAYNAELAPQSKYILDLQTGGNGSVSTAGQGPSTTFIMGSYYDSRGIITMSGAGGASPSDQGTGRGKDLMVKGGNSDNTNGYVGGRLFLAGGSGYSAGAFGTNFGSVVLQPQGGNVGIGESSPSTNCRLHITDADVQLELEGTQGASSGFINFDGTNLQFSTTRDMKTGAFRNTGKTHAGITLSGPSTGSIIRFYTTASVNTAASTRGLVLPYGEWVIGATETHSISTDFIHSIGTVNRQNLPSSAYARLVMQERTGNWISFVNGTPVHYGTIALSGSGVNYGSNSDYRLKENIVELPNAIDRVKLLSPKRFNFISAPEETRDGFLAHEVQEIVPEAVVGEKDGYIASGNVIDSEGNILKENVTYPETLEEGTIWVETKREPNYQNLDNSHLVPLLTKALQEALEKIEALEARVQQLET